MDKYDHQHIEKKWQKYWNDDQVFRADKDPDKKKYYCLTMYPYPSGTLHMGHVINYTLGDALVRYHKMKGENVLSPMGWDSFGLPAENAAIREGIDPADFTYANIDKMREQMNTAGWGFDWEREIATSHPGYYRWNQWFFTRMFNKGLAFKKDALVNWCPSCNTVLANEQVQDGACERCNTEVEQKDLNQWFFKMSAYAPRLLENHKQLKGKWPEAVLKMQEEWIGRSEGALIDFTLEDTGNTISIFTTRPDTVFGVTYMAVSPHHPLIAELVKGKEHEAEIMTGVNRLKKQSVSIRNVEEVKKEGVDLETIVINPLNGGKIRLFAANFVLMEYGTGIIMAVPAHDQRDFEFAKEYGVDIKVVINPEGEILDPAAMTEAYTDPGIMVNSGQFDGMKSTDAIPAIIDHLDNEGLGKREINYRLKDWLVSRQRYWGTPIPIIHCDDCGTVPVPDEDLPVMLPKNVEFKPTGDSPLTTCPEFVDTTCPKCGKPARRETDTMDTFVDSSWYFLRYLDPRQEDAPFREEEIRSWMPVDQYIGGIEHATMHLVYCRFLMMAFNDMGLINFDEPVARLFCQGMVCKVAHYCEKDKWLAEKDVDLEKGTCKKCGGTVVSEMTKISKTKLNTVAPDKIIDEFGADTMRLNILSDNPPDQEQVWSDESVRGAYRFVNRLFNLVAEFVDGEQEQPGRTGSQNEAELLKKLHLTIKKVTDCYETDFHFNTAIASLFELINQYRVAKDVGTAVRKEVLTDIVKMFNPVIPHMCEELWSALGGEGSLLQQAWPVFNPDMVVEDTVKMVVQVNGKVRANIEVASDFSKDEIQNVALGDERVLKFTEGKEVVKVIVVPKKLVNIVVK